MPEPEWFDELLETNGYQRDGWRNNDGMNKDGFPRTLESNGLDDDAKMEIT